MTAAPCRVPDTMLVMLLTLDFHMSIAQPAILHIAAISRHPQVNTKLSDQSTH